ncbi:MAG: S46 family peptidase [Ignavibacteria bacterium]|nr:S46 family peptidase [Ignavibacteria bacterium]
MKNKILFKLFIVPLILLLLSVSLYSQNVYNGINLDTVKAGRFDNGKMWTFDNPPNEYFKEAYNFIPTQQWYDHIMMSSLKFADYCSASFISADGLVLTNHHCGRENVTKVTKPGENLNEDGFFAYTLEEERKVPDLYVSQLIRIIDVTKEIKSAMDNGKTDEEKVNLKSEKAEELIEKYNKELGLECELVSLYNGGLYHIYAYKKYYDVRLVCAPETQIGYFGGDYDNFTYPRYNLDFCLFRVYENDKPLKTEHYFKWSEKGVDSGAVIFVVGYPASTSRLKTVAELEFMRDVLYPAYINYINFQLKIFEEQLKDKNAENREQIENEYFSYMNSLKVLENTVKNLHNPYLMARKKSFEKEFKNKVLSKPELKAKYGNVWDEISELIAQQTKKKLEGYDSFTKKMEAKNAILGRALFEVYGRQIPPDATFSLRISDGVVASYDYNGTKAPVFTTFYGIYDRYYSFEKKYPWSLPKRWINPPAELKLETPINFIGTCDIVGGNSGSPVINQDAELVGVAFDGNIESLSSDFIFTTEANRMIAVDSRAILESLRVMYKLDRVYKEIINGRISE